MNELIEKITKLISGLHDTQANHTSEILKSRYEMLEYWCYFNQVLRKENDDEQSSNES